MKYIKKFEKFDTLKENQPLEITADMNLFNEAEKNIKDFNSTKSQLLNIYLTYKEDTSEAIYNDLYTKLLNAKFIKQNSNKSKITFINPLFRIYSEFCKKSRQLKDYEFTINDKNNELLNKRRELNTNQGDSESILNDIKSIEDYINTKTTDISNIKTDINNLKVAYEKEIKLEIKKLSDAKKRIETLKTNNT